MRRWPVLSVSLDALESLLPVIEPHPELVAAMRPTSRQVTEAAGVCGLLSDEDERWFRPAVKANES